MCALSSRAAASGVCLRARDWASTAVTAAGPPPLASGRRHSLRPSYTALGHFFWSLRSGSWNRRARA